MRTLFQDFLRELRDRRDADGLRGAMAAAAAELGVGAFAYLSFPTEAGRDGPLLIATYPRDWAELYLDRRYQTIDPVIHGAARSFDPFHWSPEIAGAGEGEAAEAERTLFREAGEHGVATGYTVPVHEPGRRFATVNFALGGRDPAGLRAGIDGNEPLVRLICVYFHAHVRGHVDRLLGRDRPSLSPREAECLHWCARGKSHGDVAAILGLSRRTVKFHVENAMRKLGVATARQAVLRAAALGLIEA